MSCKIIDCWVIGNREFRDAILFTSKLDIEMIRLLLLLSCLSVYDLSFGLCVEKDVVSTRIHVNLEDNLYQ